MLSLHIAIKDDLYEIIKLLNDDELGKSREELDISIYESAFNKILSNEYNNIILLKENETIKGCAQTTFIDNLTFKGKRRCLIEGVRITKDKRNKGYGSKMIKMIIDYAKENNCEIIELTSNKKRDDAIRFYKKLGFINSHEGFKLYL